MNKTWDTFTLFEELLDQFVVLVAKASAPGGISAELRLAMAGFALFCPIEEWNERDSQFIKWHLENDLSPEDLAWFEESIPAVQAFHCLALGAMQGKFAVGQIDDDGFRFGELQLAGFISLNDVLIDEKYDQGIQKSKAPGD